MNMRKFQVKLSHHRAVATGLFSVALIVFAGDATAVTLGNVASNVTNSFDAIGKLITATSYIAGLGFAVGAIMKFKAHKDNPAQEPIGKPVGLLMVAAALLFMPTILDVTKATMFGSTGRTATSAGVEIS